MLRKLNYPLIASVGCLSLIGIIFVFEATGSFRVLREQIIFSITGFILMFLLSSYKYENFKKYSFLLLCSSIFFLVIVLVPGIGLKIYGARRWINVIFFSFQPSELIKLTLIIFFAHWFSNEEENRMTAFVLLMSFIFLLIMLQPDMGTAIIIGIISFSMFISSKTTSLKKIIYLLPGFLVLLFLVIKISPYRTERLFSFLNLEKEKYGSAYHANQALLSVGSGGLYGVGIGKSRQKYSYLPESSSDSIFGIIAEETGFVGSLLVISLYLSVFYRSYMIMKKTQNNFGKFLSLGILVFISFQAFLNLSSMLSLSPLTGVPLPFVSSGGSALIIQFAAIGILLNIERRGK